jgi:translocation and assembly module TamB
MSGRSLFSRLLRIFTTFAAMTVFVALVAVAGALVYVTTEPGEALVRSLASSATESAGLGRLEVEGLEIEFPPELRVQRLEISASGQPWLSIDELRLRPGLAALTAGHLLFEWLGAERLELHTPPQLPASTDEEKSSWLRAVVIKTLAVEQLFLGDDLVSESDKLVGPLRLHAGGVYRFEAGSFDLDGELGFAELHGAMADGEAWRAGPGTLKLDLAGRTSLVRGTASLQLARLAVAERGIADAVLSVGLTPASQRGIAVSVECSATPLDLPETAAFLFGPRISVRAEAELEVDGFVVRTAGVHVDGGAGVEIRIGAQADPDQPERLVGHIVLEGAQVAWPEAFAPVVDVLGQDASFSGDFEFEPEQSVTLSELELDFGAFSARGDAVVGLTDDSVYADLEAALSDLTFLSEPLGRASEGSVDFELTVGGSIQAMVLDATARTRSLSIESTELSAAEAAVHVTGLTDGPVAVRFTSKLGRDALMLRADGQVEIPQGRAPNLVLALRDDPGNTLDLSGDLGADAGLPRGRLVANIKSLGSVAELFGLDLAGRIDADISSDEQGISGAVDVVSLVVPGYVEVETLGIRPAQTERNAVDVQATGLHVSGVVLDAAQVMLRRIDQGWRARLALQDIHGAMDINADLELNDPPDRSESTKGSGDGSWIVARVANVEGSAGGQDVALLEPIEFESKSDGSSHLRGRLGVGDGHMNVDWTISDDGAFGEVHADGFPLRYITPFLDETLLIDGSVAADIVVPRRVEEGDDGLPSIEVTVVGARVADATGSDSFVGFDIGLVAKQRANEVVFTAKLGGRDSDELALDGSVSTTAGGIPFAGVLASSSLRATLAGGLHERAVMELAALADARLDGKLRADLRVAGTVGDPSLQGVVELLDGRYEDSASGAILQDIDVRIDASNSDTARLTLTGNDGEKGRVEGTGVVDLSAGIFAPSVSATVGLRRMRAARLDEVKALVSGELQLSAAPQAIKLAGRLTADELIIELPDRLPPEIVELAVVEENTELLDRPMRQAKVGPPGPIADLDVVIDVPGPVFVRSKEIRTDWRGRVVIGGTTAALSLDGGLDLMRGNFAALGVRVVATEGKIRFDPSPDARHSIDIRGRIRRESVVVTVIVAGDIDNVSVRLLSEPPMPENEILAFVLFGSSVSSLTPTQTVQLAVAIASLASPRRAADPLAWVRDRTGLDRISIRENEGEDQSDYMLSAGKYVRDGVFVSVEQPLGQGASEVAVELEVTERLTLKSSVGADASGGVGVEWTFDY